MALKAMQWSPDTCGCTVEEYWDPANPQAGKTFSRVVKRCPEHSTVDDSALYGVLYANPDGENKRKNRARAFLEDIGIDFSQGSGEDMVWNFTGSGASRVLHVSLVKGTLTTAQRTSLATKALDEFGSGKMAID